MHTLKKFPYRLALVLLALSFTAHSCKKEDVKPHDVQISVTGTKDWCSCKITPDNGRQGTVSWDIGLPVSVLPDKYIHYTLMCFRTGVEYDSIRVIMLDKTLGKEIGNVFFKTRDKNSVLSGNIKVPKN